VLTPKQPDEASFDQRTGASEFDYEKYKTQPTPLTSAFFLDLITEEKFIEATESLDNQTFAPEVLWLVGWRREIEGDQSAAKAAYRRCIELGDREPRNTVSFRARWRLDKLEQTRNEN
jgi:hypothetical protein